MVAILTFRSAALRKSIFLGLLFLVSALTLSNACRADIQDDMRTCESLPNSAPQPQRQYCAGMAAYRQKDYARAKTLLESAGAGGSGSALGLLGYMYETGRGVPADPSRAFHYYQQSADLGNSDGMYSLGRCYQGGIGVAKNDAQAQKWFAAAKSHGTDPGAHMVKRNEPDQADWEAGKNLYLAKNYSGALPYFRKAADAGNTDAILQVGYQYENGEGLAKSDADAAKWYARAAQAGNPIAQKNIGLMLEDAQGVPENWTQAAQWYQKSADQGYEEGQFALGRCYEFGIGVPQDRQTAILWFKRSGAQGNSKGAYFAHWLADPQNFIGFRNDDESRYVMDRIRYSPNFWGGDPAGVTFHSSRERNNFIIAFKTDSNFQQAQMQWGVRHSDYQSCQSQGGGSSCHNPGPPPTPPQSR
jgi:TPR repeat protein